MSSSPSAAASPVLHPLRTSETLALVLGVANVVFLTGRKSKGLNHSLCLQAAPPHLTFSYCCPHLGGACTSREGSAGAGARRPGQISMANVIILPPFRQQESPGQQDPCADRV